MPVPKHLSIAEACDRLGVCRSTIYNLFKRGKLRPLHIEGAVRISERDLELYLASCGPGPKSKKRRPEPAA